MAKLARLSTNGPSAFPLNDLKTEGGEVRFELHLQSEVIGISAKDEADGLRGTASFADMQGRTHARGNFLLRQIPDLRAPRSREEAWRQDFDTVLSRLVDVILSIPP